MRRHRQFGALAFLLTPICAVVAVLALFTAVSNVQQGQQDEALRQLEDSLKRAAVTSYATEGVYPPTLEDLQQRYGIQVDGERFAVFYDIFADNRMPDITVVPIR